MAHSFFDILLVGFFFLRKEHFDVTGRPATSNKFLGFLPLGQAPRSGSYCQRDDLYLCCKNQTFAWIQLVKWPCFKISLFKNPAKCPNLQYLDVKKYPSMGLTWCHVCSRESFLSTGLYTTDTNNFYAWSKKKLYKGRPPTIVTHGAIYIYNSPYKWLKINRFPWG